MAQTPTQRLANKRFAQQEEKKMGTLRLPKAERADAVTTSSRPGRRVQTTTVALWMVYLLVFLMLGGFVLEIIKLLFG